MLSNKGIKVVMGGATKPLMEKTENSAKEVPEFLDRCTKYGVDTIDSAVIYGDSTELLGTYGAAERGFTLDTKIPGGTQPGTCDEEGAYQIGKESIQKMKTKQADILYLHSPDDTIPIASTLAGIDKLYKEGLFRRFGVSNLTPEQVQEAYDICKQKGYVLPSVYQGNYNAFARRYEAPDNLLPLLRKLKMSFYAYSPAAGGYLAKTPETLFAAGSRLNSTTSHPFLADMYSTLYAKKRTLLEGLTTWNQIANDAGITPGSMALRWVKYNSALRVEFGDAFIIGPKGEEQMRSTMRDLDAGPLSDDVVRKIDELWETIKDEAPVDNFHSFMKAIPRDGGEKTAE